VHIFTIADQLEEACHYRQFWSRVDGNAMRSVGTSANIYCSRSARRRLSLPPVLEQIRRKCDLDRLSIAGEKLFCGWSRKWCDLQVLARIFITADQLE